MNMKNDVAFLVANIMNFYSSHGRKMRKTE